MALIDLQTDLRSLKYGKDKPGGGDSRQPFIKRKIPKNGEHSDAPDFLLRNGFLNPVNSVTDVLRISKFFTTIAGINFIAKQQALIMTTPLSLGGRSANPLGSQINIAYNPIQTLAQVGGNSVGLHTERNGLAKKPTGEFDPLSLLPDFDNFTTKYEYLQTFEYNQDDAGNDNRLVNLYRKIINVNDGPVTEKSKLTFGIDVGGTALLKYIGGPNIDVRSGGTTRIRRAVVTNNPYPSFSFDTGSPRPVEINYQNILLQGVSSKYESITEEGPEVLINAVVSEDGGLLFTPNIYLPGTLDVDTENLARKKVGPYQFEGNDKNKLGATYNYRNATIDPSLSDDNLFNGNGKVNINNNVYVSGTLDTNFDSTFPKSSATLTSEEIREINPISQGGQLADFRKKINEAEDTQLLPETDYSQFNREKTYQVGDPGRQATRLKYTVGPQDADGNALKDTQDKINLYTSTARDNEIEQSDLIQFNIRVINNDSLADEFIYFRAYLDEFSESLGADWGEHQYVGRGQKFFTYKGFDRSFSLGFTVFAHSRSELLPIYRKLNRLIGATAPDYSNAGFMRGSIIKLTVGDYITNHPVVLKGFSVSNMLDFSWETGRDENGKRLPYTEIQQLPHGFKVTGFNATSISGGGFGSQNYIPGKGKSFAGLGLA